MTTRIWNLTKTFPGKVNFIDSNNVILGYDLNQNCCEDAFWSVGPSPDGTYPLYLGDENAEQEIELVGYVFDPEFHRLIEDESTETYVATFKLVHSGWGREPQPDLYVRLENHHNGYYSHGFTFRGDVVIQGSL